MRIFNNIKENIYELFILTTLTIAESYYIVQAIFSDSNRTSIVVLSIFAIVLLSIIIFLLPKKISLVIVGVIVLGIGTLTYYFFESIIEFVQIAYDILLNGGRIHVDLPIIVISFLTMFIYFLNYVCVVLLKKGMVAAIISIVIPYVLYHLYGYTNLWILAFIFFTILVLFLRWISPQKLNDNKTNNKQFLIPFVSVLIVAAITAPLAILLSNSKPTPLAWIDDLEWFESEEVQTSGKVIIRIDGQSKLTNLTNEFTYTDTEMMIVNSPYLGKLRNKTYDIYNKDGWQKEFSDTDKNNYTQYTYDEMIGILNNNNIPYTEYNMDVQLIAQSQMIFAPLHSTISSSFENDINLNPYDDRYVDNPLIEGSTYSLEALNIDYASKGFLTLITNSKSDDLKNMANYTDISPYLRRSLKPLAENLTKDADSNYVKVKIIESYISSQFEYTLNPPEKPENKDFVEYFLFETKQGFCTHYASSMVMLLRSIDIPCRYVTGYLLAAPYTDDDISETEIFLQGEPYDFIVQKDHSHAWVEVWFDDFGWLAFEPTSRYVSYQNLDYPANNDFSDMDFEGIDIQEPKTENNIDDRFFLILGLVFSAFVLIVAAVRIYIVINRTHQEKIAVYWQLLKKRCYRKQKIEKNNETTRDFYARIDDDDGLIKEAMHLYEMALFSNKEIGDEHVQKMKDLYKKR